MNWLERAINNPALLSAIHLTTAAKSALSTLITMLNSLLEDNMVLKFILNNISSNFEVMGTIVDGQLVPYVEYSLPNAYTVPKPILIECSNAGVYFFNHIEIGRQYIGSASSFPSESQGTYISLVVQRYLQNYISSLSLTEG